MSEPVEGTPEAIARHLGISKPPAVPGPTGTAGEPSETRTRVAVALGEEIARFALNGTAPEDWATKLADVALAAAGAAPMTDKEFERRLDDSFQRLDGTYEAMTPTDGGAAPADGPTWKCPECGGFSFEGHLKRCSRAASPVVVWGDKGEASGGFPPASPAVRLPNVEAVSAQVHEAWMASKRAAGVTSRRSEAGEELMVPYAALSEPAKDLDRGTVRAVYAAITATLAAEGEPAGPTE